jgi:ribosomal protein S17E
MYLYNQRIKTGQIQKPSAKVYNNYRQKYLRYYGLAKKKVAQPIQIPQKNLNPFYTK